MRFTALSPQAALVFLALTILFVVLLYALKPRIPRMIVSSTLFWQTVIRGQRTLDRRRWLLSVLLASCVALSIALALTQPQLNDVGQNPRYLIVLDDSPSMAARTADGGNRWRHALARARAFVASLDASSQILVVDTMGALAPSGWVSRDAAFAGVAKLAPATAGSARLPPLPVADTRTKVHLFSDGVSELRPAAGTIEHSVFEAADNVAVTAFEARPLANDPERYEAFVQILNASATSKKVTLLITGAAGFQLSRERDIIAGESIEETLDVSHYPEGALQAEVQADGDAFDADNRAYTFVARHRTMRVLLVTEGNSFLQESIRALPGVALAVQKPAAYQPAAFDAFVFDRFAPQEAPPAGTLLFQAPAASWLTAMPKRIRNPSISSWDNAHPLTAGIAWPALRIRNALVADSGPADLVSAHGSAGGALVIAGKATAPWIEVGFALHESNFPLQPGFPVFIANALNWLVDKPDVLSHEIGTIEVPLSGAEVRDGQGRPIATVQAPGATVFQANHPGLYTVSNAHERLHVSANVLDPAYAQINRSRFADRSPEQATLPISNRGLSAEPWVLLLLLGVALLVADWLTFTRRMTV